MPRDVAADTRTATASVAATAADRQTDKQALKKCVARGCGWKSAVWQCGSCITELNVYYELVERVHGLVATTRVREFSKTLNASG